MLSAFEDFVLKFVLLNLQYRVRFNPQKNDAIVIFLVLDHESNSICLVVQKI